MLSRARCTQAAGSRGGHLVYPTETAAGYGLLVSLLRNTLLRIGRQNLLHRGAYGGARGPHSGVQRDNGCAGSYDRDISGLGDRVQQHSCAAAQVGVHWGVAGRGYAAVFWRYNCHGRARGDPLWWVEVWVGG